MLLLPQYASRGNDSCAAGHNSRRLCRQFMHRRCNSLIRKCCFVPCRQETGSTDLCTPNHRKDILSRHLICFLWSLSNRRRSFTLDKPKPASATLARARACAVLFPVPFIAFACLFPALAGCLSWAAMNFQIIFNLTYFGLDF